VTPPPAQATAASVPAPAPNPPRAPAAPTAPSPRRPAAPRVPRRVSGPAAARTLPKAEAAAARLRSVLDAPFLDRLTRGRAWIGLVAVGLIGIVFMQVSLLRLNAGIGRKIADAQALERENAQLRDSVSRLGSGDRIQEVAASRGLVMPPSGTFHYLSVRPGDATRAARMMKPPINPIADDLPASTPTPAPAAANPAPATTSTPTATTPTATTPTATSTTTPQTSTPATSAQPVQAAPPAAPAPTQTQAATAQTGQ
jgi:hypothetical protein